ncbi:MAG: L,D-transpeptidase [Patescibacteria group bacterium]|nr:L,D-transpeptidase [Patescibacteria group bacterium]
MKKKNRSSLKKTEKIINPRRYISLFVGFFAVLFALVLIVGNHLGANFCANSISCIDNLSGKVDPIAKTALFMGKEIAVPGTLLAQTGFEPVLGASSNPNKHIYVDLTNQKLYAFDGNDLVFTFPVSTGKWNQTPTGNFHIWIKLDSTRMTGGSGADFYDLPNVPRTMFFTNDKDVTKAEGYAIHGAYWNPPFGHPYSHGCVNLSVDDAKSLYDWADPTTTSYSTYATNQNPGTLITVFGVTPDN